MLKNRVRRWAGSFAAIVILAVLGFPQQSPPAAAQSIAPKDAKNPAPAAPSPVYESTAVLKIKTRLVVVDVVARDSKGAPVADLKRDDFSILEDGKEQKVRIFSFQQPDASLATQAPTPAQPANMVDNLPHFQAGRALNVVLMDALNTSHLNQAFMQESMIKFLEKLPENEPIAVYLLGDRLRLLQDFTTDPALLKKVVRSFKGKNSPLLNEAPDGTTLPALFPGISQAAPQLAAQIVQFQNQLTTAITDQRVHITLSALNSLARTLSGYPGRKNLIWISEAFPFDVLLAGASPVNNRDYSPQIALTGNLLSDSQIAIYPLDARGLANGSFYSVGTDTDPYGNSLASSALGGGTSSQLERDVSVRMVGHATMNDLAERTGGRAFYNRNDLEGAVLDSINDGSTYYTLGYYPDNKEWNGAFRKIQVKVHRSGVKLRYRIGYFAVDNAAFARLNPKKQDEDFNEALSLNVPVSTALPFKAMVMPPSAKTQNKVVVNYGVDPHALSFEATNDGLERVNVECAVRVFTKKNPDKPVVTEAQKMGGAMKPDAYARVMKSFFPCRDQLSLQPGEYVLRLGVRDNETGLLGTANALLTIPAESGSAGSPDAKRQGNKP